jgi:hypothetical protein
MESEDRLTPLSSLCGGGRSHFAFEGSIPPSRVDQAGVTGKGLPLTHKVSVLYPPPHKKQVIVTQ